MSVSSMVVMETLPLSFLRIRLGFYIVLISLTLGFFYFFICFCPEDCDV